jgi:hypothetical protein
MIAQRYYVAQFVIALEDQWFALGIEGSPVRVERRYRVVSQLFAAADPESAYQTAANWLPGFSDSNHDGRGDLFVMSSIGIHEIEEIHQAMENVAQSIHQMYGVDVGSYAPTAVDADGVPIVRSKAELAIFNQLQK